MENNELMHHGIRGQKWGVRRYQNPDGSLTTAGQKRRSLGETIHNYKVKRQRKKNLEKARIARAEKQKKEAERKKLLDAGLLPAKKMTDDELRAKIERINLEKSYKEATRNNQSYSRGKRFVNKLLDATVDKVAEQATADIIAQTVKVFEAKVTNQALKGEVVFTNNKRKS